MADGSIVIDTSVDGSGLKSGLSQLGSAADTAMKGMAIAIGAVSAALGVAGGYAIKVGSDFEAGMSQVAATMGITVAEIESGSDEFQKLEQAAKDMGATTQFSATQASEALNYLALAGYDADKSIAALPDVLNLAAAGGLDLGYASDMVTDSMSALGMETDQLTGFVDQLSKTSQKSNTDIAQLGSAILTVGGTAKNLADGTVELNTALGILADNGIKGAEGGTALRNIILSLSAPTDKAAGALKKLGIEAFDAQGNLRPLNEVFEDFNTKLSALSQEEQIQSLNKIFNKVDLKSVNALLAGTVKNFDGLSTALSSAGVSSDYLDSIIRDLTTGLYDVSDKAAFVSGVMADWGLTQEQAEIAFEALNSELGEGVSRFDELSAMIRDSTGAAQEQANTLNNNLKGSLTILGSTVEGLGISFYDNIKVSATNAVKSLIGTLSGHEFKSAFDSFSKSTGKMIDGIAEISEDLLPLAAKGFAFFAENLREIVTVTGAAYLGFKSFSIIGSVTTAVQSMSAAWGTAALQLSLYSAANGVAATQQAALNGSLTLGQIAVGVLTGQIGLATAAQGAWNIVMAANPVGLIVAGVGALTVGLAAYFALTKDSTSATQELCDEADELVQSSQEMRDALEGSAQQRQKEREAMEAEAGAAKVLADRLYNLADKTNKTAGEKQEMLSLVDQLNQAIPGLNLAYDAENDRLSKQREEVDGLIDANLELLKAKAAQEDRIKIAEEIYQTEKKRNDLMQERKKIQEELTQREAELKAAIEDTSNAYAVTDLMAAHKFNTEDLRKQVADIDAEIVNIEGDISSMNGEFDRCGEYIKNTAESAENAAENMEDMGEAGAEAGEKIGQSAASMAEDLGVSEEAVEKLQKRFEGYLETATDIFSKIGEASEHGIDEMIANLEANQKAMNEWADNLVLAAERGVDEGLLYKLQTAGPEAAGYVKALVDASDTEISRLNEVFRNGSETAINTYNAELSVMEGDTSILIGRAVQAAQDIFRDGIPGISSVTRELADAAVDSLSSLESSFRSIGEAAMEGLRGGIENKIDSVVSVGKLASDMIVSGVRKNLKVNSPSKRTMQEIGMPFMEGIGVGIKKALPGVEGQMESSVEEMVSRMEAMVAAESSAAGANAVAQQYSSVSNSNTVNLGGIKNHIDYYGGGSPADADGLMRRMAQKTQQSLRARGVRM